MKTYITGDISVELCNWIYDDIRNNTFNRVKTNKLLNLAIKYNTNHPIANDKWVYDNIEQSLIFYGELCSRKEVWFKKQLVH